MVLNKMYLSPAGAGAILRVDLGALVDNYCAMVALVAPTEVAAVVKADGYGLGILHVVRALHKAGCRRFFVAHVNEAISLRHKYSAPIEVAVLNGIPAGAEAYCVALDIIPVLNSLDQIERWRKFSHRLSRRLSCMLQFDTGMSRLGLSADDVRTLHKDPILINEFDIKLILSHLACSNDPFDNFNLVQTDRFEGLCKYFPSVPRSLDNSGGALLPRPHFDVVRAGISLYGGTTDSRLTSARPVVSLHAQIIQVRELEANCGIGYDLTFRTTRPSRLGILSIGYGDGWPRALGNRGAAFVGGMRVPIVGRISMDSLTIDVTDVPDGYLAQNPMVELLGPHQSLDDVARDANTISYEILTQLGHRYARDYVYS